MHIIRRRTARRRSTPRPSLLTPAHVPARALAVALVAALVSACGGDTGDTDEAGAAGGAVADTQSIAVNDAGFQMPESVLHDETADVYLVSNINGAPLDRDDNGFVSRVQPDGTVAELKWVDGSADNVTLHAPKGLALKGDTLFVSDIDTVRAFHRETGQPLGARGVEGATFLNDLAVGPDGTLYVSDSGMNPDFSSSGTDAVHAFRGGGAEAVAEGTDLSGPNGLAVDDQNLIVVSFGAPDIRFIPLNGGTGQLMATLPGGQLDGVVMLDDGSLLVSSWESQAVFQVGAGGDEVTEVVSGVPSPADIGWDETRRRVLIPVFQEDRLVFEPIGT